ncbi:hypothetical protein FHR90_003049 [Endobacter medicaginis]|uniref:NrtR DNA-binding winged helix domain-containing protein n=1 Tax=Endobacter medicaginis TaxID=1181271 RepID=A0A850NMS3_9PROT|nr:hypothetical protein [Endobacter medicaginis]MBB3175195.1 hypothetical protein [Endobacter medicaginis]MCX5476780.1 hypothetical protein [Endobacter medicaginis]NVN30224.1 hypothetical protein [Endobacter medicaginis]
MPGSDKGSDTTVERMPAAELVAVLAAVDGANPVVLSVDSEPPSALRALPSGPMEPGHRSLQAGVRSWVERQTRHPLGHIEQLYTFADRGEGGPRAVSISYLALTRIGTTPLPGWRGWYAAFPWEDHRSATGRAASEVLLDALERWCGPVRARRQRARALFGRDGVPWHPEWVLQRYELLFEAGLIAEAGHPAPLAETGTAMWHDHRRILATGIARLRAKIQYHPVVFEMLPDSFTLLHLQQSVEAIAGRLVHKQNFRRLIAAQELVEETGQMSAGTGRPARLYRFRGDVMRDRAVVGTKLPR